MSRGLTDKETLEATMTASRIRRRETARAKALATKGLNAPDQLAPAEIQEMCAAVLRAMKRWEALPFI